MITPADTVSFAEGWTGDRVICKVRRPVRVSGRVRFTAGGYMPVYRPSELDRLYLAFTAANLAGNAGAMRTAGRAIRGVRAAAEGEK